MSRREFDNLYHAIAQVLVALHEAINENRPFSYWPRRTTWI